MSAKTIEIPEECYGVMQLDQFDSPLEEVADQVRRLGFAILDSGFSSEELKEISDEFDRTRKNYLQKYGEERLKSAKELHMVRAPILHGGGVFKKLAVNQKLLAVLGKLIAGKFILNQQNGLINPPEEKYIQGAWHRDLPYQHFVSSSPIAVNALFCVDDFTLENGATFILPASHMNSRFPSKNFVQANAVQVEARAGQYIVLDCMLFHAGGRNRTNKDRRAVNHVYTIPYFKQQINLSKELQTDGLSDFEKDLFGLSFLEADSIENYIRSRILKGS
jgi:ectoine hydroxylase-related dioxygenase (phytanoyl-CoA dioxygenase family)